MECILNCIKKIEIPNIELIKLWEGGKNILDWSPERNMYIFIDIQIQIFLHGFWFFR